MTLSPGAAHALAAARYPSFVTDLATLVGIDSESWDAAGANRIADIVCERAAASGCRVERATGGVHEGRPLGDRVTVRRPGSGTTRILLLAHMDTVFARGTAAARPFRVVGGRAYGPGVCDDKAGLLAGLTVLDILGETDAGGFAEVVLCCVPDEEIGSPTSRDEITRLAADADVVLSLEGAREDGSVVSSRKGIADVAVTLTGRAAHPGVDAERGANAVVAAALLVADLHRITADMPGVRVNVGRIAGGERVNVVAASATVELEVRVDPQPGLDEAIRRIRHLVDTTYVPGVTASMTVSNSCPPMRRDPAQDVVLDEVRAVAHALGFAVGDAATGGAADANYAAAAGVPTLDGLGPVGGDDHSVDEWLDLDSVVPRIALLACLITRLPAAIGCVGAVTRAD